MAFGYRAADCACGVVGRAETIDASTSSEPRTKAVEKQQKCSLSTTLRFLQAMASVQAGPHSALVQLAGRALEHLKEMRPQQCFYLLQALSRLRLRHPKAVKLLHRLSLTWRTLPAKKFVKAANAVAKLDLASNLWAKPLKLALLSWLPRISGRHLANLKAIAAIELLEEPSAMRCYLEQCQQHRKDFWYSRHLQMVELHVHLLRPDLWATLEDSLKAFLQEFRIAAEERRGKVLGAATATAATEPDTSSDDEEEVTLASHQLSYDKRRFSSALHQDLSRVLKELEVEHHNQLAAGPLVLDICHVPSMTVIEASARWQFYLRSPQMTALARVRQELLRAMGFTIVAVAYHRWEILPDDDAKAAWLRSELPGQVFSPKAIGGG